MSGGSRIIAFGSSEEKAAEERTHDGGHTAQAHGDIETHDLAEADDAIAWLEEADTPPAAHRNLVSRIAAAIGIVLVIGWTAFFVWANLPRLAPATPPSEWASMIAGWSMPVLLVCMVWLIAMRSSSREATRFGNAARLLSDESERLETRLTAVNRELSLARDFLASQSRDLEAMGRLAAERLSENANRLQELVRENGSRVETIGQVSGVALSNMEKLRGQLPVISSSAKDVANNIGNAGRVAHNQLEEMIRGFNRINEFGQASESQVISLRRIVEETLAGFSEQCDQLEKIAAARFAELGSQSNEFRTRLDAHEVETLAAIRQRAAALSEEVDAARAEIDSTEQSSLESLRARIAAIRDESGIIARSLSESTSRAITGWQRELASLEEEREALFARIDQADAETLERVRQRLASIEDERNALFARIERADDNSLEHARQRFAAIEEEQSALFARIERADTEATERTRQRLAAIEDERRTLFARIDQADEDTLERTRQRLGALEEERATLIGRIEHADESALERARERMTAVTAEAELIESGIAERAERLIAGLSLARKNAEAAEQAAVMRFTELLDSIDAQIADRAQSYQRHVSDLAANVENIGGNLGQSGEEIARIAEVAAKSGEQVAANLAQVSGRLAQARAAITQTEDDFTGLTESSVRLLELVKASSDHAGIDLAEALQTAGTALADAEARSKAVSDNIDRAGKSGQWLANQIDGSGSALKALLEQINRMQLQLRDQAITHQEELSALLRRLGEVEKQGDALSEKARTELAEAISVLEGSARDAVRIISEEGVAGVAAIADQIREASGQAIEAALRDSAAVSSGQLQEAATQAVNASREATIQMRDQLGRVNELVSNLESRVTRARERAEEQVNNDFSRRAALITEALNSNAIDIAKALSSEVSDTAWEGYLRGDRGIFTRRAVSLIESGDARAIHAIFESDPGFREHVSRYIHDFEAILRQVLSTRDGNALGVTLLSSDMGKLYVALAQAIERLRT